MWLLLAEKEIINNNFLINLPVRCLAAISREKFSAASFVPCKGRAALPAALIACEPREGGKFHHSWVKSGLNRGPILAQIIPMEKLLLSHQGWRNTKKGITPGVLSFYSDNTIPKAIEKQTEWPLWYRWTGWNSLNQNCDWEDKQRWQPQLEPFINYPSLVAALKLAVLFHLPE